MKKKLLYLTLNVYSSSFFFVYTVIKKISNETSDIRITVVIVDGKKKELFEKEKKLISFLWINDMTEWH